ncbi:uncharacterized protein SPPG_02881 [Spizellomyces punctatus DAOM BR117]|uniref:Uncharacterized protein n=1 Tax=Spizellomyces punctatus (strain DAOM BR117) TaxID=645134 RepID=A0A0L0HN98_SPIPD|nr:uncharacterized protein SPPG_02881 [Spizellomyces punctatus DAOM BR117]KND02415.1 hypothetical protein SPPG_02881 [Spizellomyces punctatus DAOM BR117]|eukprot:XP_016610454.1 hypothetical protein SPPG_02881 [Spizellomyces punctatus DAOM BR117]
MLEQVFLVLLQVLALRSVHVTCHPNHPNIAPQNALHPRASNERYSRQYATLVLLNTPGATPNPALLPDAASLSLINTKPEPTTLSGSAQGTPETSDSQQNCPVGKYRSSDSRECLLCKTGISAPECAATGTTTHSSAEPLSRGGWDNLNGGAKAAVVGGPAIALAGLCIMAWLCVRQRKSKKEYLQIKEHGTKPDDMVTVRSMQAVEPILPDLTVVEVKEPPHAHLNPTADQPPIVPRKTSLESKRDGQSEMQVQRPPSTWPGQSKRQRAPFARSLGQALTQGIAQRWHRLNTSNEICPKPPMEMIMADQRVGQRDWKQSQSAAHQEDSQPLMSTESTTADFLMDNVGELEEQEAQQQRPQESREFDASPSLVSPVPPEANPFVDSATYGLAAPTTETPSLLSPKILVTESPSTRKNNTTGSPRPSSDRDRDFKGDDSKYARAKTPNRTRSPLASLANRKYFDDDDLHNIKRRNKIRQAALQEYALNQAKGPKKSGESIPSSVASTSKLRPVRKRTKSSPLDVMNAGDDVPLINFVGLKKPALRPQGQPSHFDGSASLYGSSRSLGAASNSSGYLASESSHGMSNSSRGFHRDPRRPWENGLFTAGSMLAPPPAHPHAAVPMLRPPHVGMAPGMYHPGYRQVPAPTVQSPHGGLLHCAPPSAMYNPYPPATAMNGNYYRPMPPMMSTRQGEGREREGRSRSRSRNKKNEESGSMRRAKSAGSRSRQRGDAKGKASDSSPSRRSRSAGGRKEQRKAGDRQSVIEEFEKLRKSKGKGKALESDGDRTNTDDTSEGSSE